MKAAVVKVNAKNQTTILKSVRQKLQVKAGDRLLLDVQDGLMVLIPEPASFADYLQGLHREIWKGVDVKKYPNGERRAWSKIKAGVRK
jgi:AbrB family looped-hinge helix DNA binding protein